MAFESLTALVLEKYVVQLLYALKSNYLMCVFDGDRVLELLCSCGNRRLLQLSKLVSFVLRKKTNIKMFQPTF